MDFYADATTDAPYVEVRTSTASAPRAIVHALPVAASPQSKVLILAQFEVTNALGYNVGLGRYIARSDGKIISRATMDNVTPDMHHRVVNIGVWDDSPLESAVYYLVCYAASTAAKPGAKIVIEQGYGFLQAMRFDE